MSQSTARTAAGSRPGGPQRRSRVLAIDVLFVCTGNICRSPMAEALLRARLADRAPTVEVGSAGLLFDGREAEPQAVKALAKRGLALDEFRSQTISPEVLEGVALVLGMERRHVREVAAMVPSLFTQSFTLPEFVASASTIGPRNGEPLAAWVGSAGQDRGPKTYLGADPGSEVADPYGSSARRFRACAEELDALLDELVDLAWPSPSTGGTS